jgi:2-polyprenyl-3-methyl-5-hydroxy-6-metoxy-1,4-benzoquinol methylase
MFHQSDTHRAPAIAYKYFREAFTGYLPRLGRLIEEVGASRVCDVGGGAKPALDLGYVGSQGLDYVVVDVSASELAKASDGYVKVVADICEPGLDLGSPFDVVFTSMVAEHIKDPARFHANIRALLRPGGYAFHMFATFYSMPSVLNRLLPARVGEPLLQFVQPGREPEGDAAKFPAYYRWCRGPSRRQLSRFADVGFTVEEYVGFFGHGYFESLPPLQRLSDALTSMKLKHPVPALTTDAWVVLRRPESA